MLAHCNSDLTVHFHHLTKGLLQLPYEQVISETIKERTVLQIKTALQKKAYEEAGIQVQNSVPTNKIMQGMLIVVTLQRKTKNLFLKVNLAQALQRSLLTPSMPVKVR